MTDQRKFAEGDIVDIRDSGKAARVTRSDKKRTVHLSTGGAKSTATESELKRAAQEPPAGEQAAVNEQ